MYLTIFILILLFSGCIFILYYKYEEKISHQKKQLIILSRQNKEMKNKLNYRSEKLTNLSVVYKRCNYSHAVINEDCNLHLAPLNNSIILSRLNKDIKINILDTAETMDTLWYEIDIKRGDRINTKGWVQEKNITKIKIGEE